MATKDPLEVHLEELGQRSWWRAALGTLTGSYGSGQYRFVARPADADETSEPRVVGATFPMMRFQNLDDLTEPNAWLATAQERLQELDAQLVGEGWRREPGTGRHWWSMRYSAPA